MTYSRLIELSSSLDARARDIIAANYPHFTPSTSAYREVLQLHTLRIYLSTLPLSNSIAEVL